MKKNILTIIFSFLVALSLFLTIEQITKLQAQQGNVITIGSDTVSPGDVITVTVTTVIPTGDLLGAATVDVIYNSEVVQVAGCNVDPANRFESKTCNDSFSNDTIRFNVVSLNGLSGDIALASLTFQAVGNIGEISSLELNVQTIASPTGEMLSVTPENGQIEIIGGPQPAQGTIAIGSGDVLPNEQITIPITATIPDHQLGAATIDITYNPEIIQIVNCTVDPTNRFESKTCNDSFSNDTIRFNVVSLNGLSGDIALASLTFQAVGNIGEISSLELNVQTIVSPTGETLLVTLENGQIEIIQANQAELRITKTAYQEYPEALHVRDKLTYEIVLTNDGPGEATDLVIEDTLPNTLNLESFNTTSGSISPIFQADGSTLVRVTVPRLGNSRVIVNLVTTVKENALGANVVNIAQAQYDGGTLSSGVVVSPDPNSSNPIIQPALPDYVYLPSIVRQPTPIPTPTPTRTPTSTPTRIPTSTPTSVAQRLVNGNFEQGTFGWTEYSAKGWTLIMHTDDFPEDVTLVPHSGNWVVWLGGDENETAYIRQSVTVQSSAPYLTYWHWIASQDVCGYDFGGVGIDGTWYDRYDLCDSNNTNGWVFHTVDMRAYAGQRINLDIAATTDGSNNSNLFVDDVSFRSNRMASQQAPQYNPMIDLSMLKSDIDSRNMIDAKTNDPSAYTE